MVLKNTLWIFLASCFSLSAGKRCEEMERGVVGAAAEDDGGKTVARRV